MKSHLILGGRPSVSGRSCNKRMVVHCDDKLSRGNADFGRILVRFYPFICQGCDSFCVGVFLISESCMLVHHGKIVQGAYGLITARSLKNLPAKALLSNHIWLKLALPTSFAIYMYIILPYILTYCSPFESKTLSTASAFVHVFFYLIHSSSIHRSTLQEKRVLFVDIPYDSWFASNFMVPAVWLSRRFLLGTHITKLPLWFLGTAAW